MQAYRTETGVAKNGVIHLAALPFQEGEMVEVIVLPRTEEPRRLVPISLKGKVIEYTAPTDPVAQDDWEAAS